MIPNVGQAVKRKRILIKIAISCCCLLLIYFALAFIVLPGFRTAISSAYSEILKEAPVGDFWSGYQTHTHGKGEPGR
jgi:hypothetical protein